MKKGFLSAIVTVGVLGAWAGADAQITLLQTFEGLVSTGYVAIINNGLDFNGYYVGTTSVTSPIRFYNEDFSVRTSVNISVPNGYKISSVSCVSEKIFNADSKLEFIVTFDRSTTTTDEHNSNYIMRLYDESGSVLKDFGTAYIFSAGIALTSTGHYRLHVFKYEYAIDGATKYYTDIYSLPGKKEVSSTSSPPQIKERQELAYKLKEGETATMKIYNIKGQVVETKTIDHTFNKILLNTARYPRGTYIYKINDKNATKFVLR